MGKRAAILFVEMMHSAGEAQHGDVHFETSRISDPPQCRHLQRAKDAAGVEAIVANRSERCQRHSDSKKHPLKIHPGRAQPPHFKYSPTEAIHR